MAKNDEYRDPLDAKLDQVIGTMLTVLVGGIIFCVLFVPVLVNMAGTLTGDMAAYVPFIGLIIAFAGLGLVVFVVRNLSMSSKR